MAQPLEDVLARARRVRLVLLDVDGVMTDGTVSIHAEGGETKTFSIRDGAAIVWARREGLEVGFLSGRPSGATSRRAEELGVKIVLQEGPDKRGAYERFVEQRGIADDAVAYMGDDSLDLPILGRVGLGTAPADAAEPVRARAHWVSQYPGGRGAVRDLVELLLRARGRWDELIGQHVT